MATVSFHLKAPHIAKPTAIFALVTFDKQRIKVYSGLSILPKQWLKAEQRAQVRGYSLNGAINDALDLLEQRLTTCYAEHRALGLVPSVETLRGLAAPVVIVSSNVPAARSFGEIFTEWTTLTRAQGKVRTAQAGEATLHYLQQFESHARYAVTFSTITPAFGDAFTMYLLNTVRLTDNTIAKHLDRLRRFMRFAADRNYTDVQRWEWLVWKRQEPDVITLTAEEVAALEDLELPVGSYLDNARTLFLLSCYTGLRYSDLVAIRPEHIRGSSLRITTQKTRETLNIPLQARALVIVTRYLAGGVRLITNQKLNNYLKELGQRAGIMAPVEVILYRGGTRDSRTEPKWRKLGCHTGRRTFVTLSLERGLRPEVVMKITGHKDWKSFRRYVNITEQAVDREFARVYEMP